MSSTTHTSPISPPPGHQDPDARLAASAEVHQVGGTICAICGYARTSPDCPTDDQVVSWFDSQSEAMLTELGIHDGLTPRQIWNEFFLQRAQVSKLIEEVTSFKSFPSPAHCLDKFGRVVGEAFSVQQLGFVSESRDCQLSVLTGYTLQLLTDELADVNGGIRGNDPGLLESSYCRFVDRIVSSYGRAFVVLVHIVSSDSKEGDYNIGSERV